MDKYKEFSDLRIKLRCFVSTDIRDPAGKKVGTKSYEEYETTKGIIKSENWYDQVYNLIKKYDEIELLENLKKYVKENCAWLKEATEEAITEYALELHCNRIFENPAWVGYEKFKEMPIKKEQLCLI